MVNQLFILIIIVIDLFIFLRELSLIYYWNKKYSWPNCYHFY